MATVQFGHIEPLMERIAALGADPMEAMAPFVKPFDVFHAATAPSDWLEGLIKAYVGDGLAADFYVEIASYLDGGTRQLIVDSSPTPATRTSSSTGSAAPSRTTTASAAGSPCGAAG